MKKIKVLSIILSLLIAVGFVLSPVPLLAGAEPMSEPMSDIIHISTEAELRAIPGGWSSEVRHYVLVNDIELTAPWLPIVDFQDIFDGQGHSIRNVNVSSVTNAGFFGSVRSGIIRNVRIYSGADGIVSTGTGNQSRAGGLVGDITGGNVIIDNCHFIGSVRAARGAGGLIGAISGMRATVRNSTAVSGPYATVPGVGRDCVSAVQAGNHAAAGGLVGLINGSGALIENSHTSIRVSASISGNINVAIAAVAGGLVGEVSNTAIIRNSSATGSTSAIVSGGLINTQMTSRAGGLVGRMTTADTVENSFAAGNVMAQNNIQTTSRPRAGGLLGEVTGTGTTRVINSFRLNTQHVHGTLVILNALGTPISLEALADSNPLRDYIPSLDIITLDMPESVRTQFVDISGISLASGTHVSIYCCDELAAVIPVVNSRFGTTLTLTESGEHTIRVSTAGNGRVISAIGTVRQQYRYPVLQGFRVYYHRPTVDLIRADGVTDILWLETGRALTFVIEIDTPENQMISEVNIVTGSGERFGAIPVDGRWVFVDAEPDLNAYLSGRLNVEVTWQIGGDLNTQIREILGFTPSRFDDSVLMPSSEPLSCGNRVLTTSAYVSPPNASPNSGATVLNPNEGDVLVAPGLTLRTAAGSEIWWFEATQQAVGRTHVFWAHGGRYREFIFATINAPGEFPIGTLQNGMNHLDYLGYIEERVTVTDIIGGSGDNVTRLVPRPVFRPAFDPSGFVFEAVPSNRLENVQATVFRQSDGGIPWNAQEYEQENPLITDGIGFYRWDVPEGSWRVRYEKDGFETVYSI